MDTRQKIRYGLDFLVLGSAIVAGWTGNAALAASGVAVYLFGQVLRDLGDELEFNKHVA